MKPMTALFTATTAVVFLQLSLGGLLTFNFIDPHFHIISGFVLFILVIATMVASIVSKPQSKSLVMVSTLLILLMILQVLLGFNTLDTGSQLVAWIHFVNATVILGVAISGTFAAIKLSQDPAP